MAIKMLNLVADRGQYIRLLNGVRFEHLGRIYDLRNISEADADTLAADPSCQFLGKQNVTKGSTTDAKGTEQPSGTPQKKAGDARVDETPATPAVASTDKKAGDASLPDPEKEAAKKK